MQLSRIISACALNGVTVDKVRENYYVLTKGEQRLTMHPQDDHVGHLTYHSPQTDTMTDCYCDSYFDTIKGAMHFLNPSGVTVKAERVASVARPFVQVERATVSKNEEKNGIEIAFPGKPAQNVIDSLKADGYRWSSFAKVWWKAFTQSEFDKACERYMEKVEA